MLRINTNVAAFNTLRQARLADTGVSKALERLSSGLRVNRASDDAAGLSISESLRTQVRGSDRAAKNIQDGISLINVADGALNEIHDVLQRMRELAVQASNGTLTTADRAATEQEFASLQAEITNISNYTSFNGMQLFIGQGGSYVTNPQPQSTSIGSNVGTTTLTLVGPPATALGAISLTATDSSGPPGASMPVTIVGAPTQVQVGTNGVTPLYQYTVTIDNTTLAGTPPWNITGSATMTYPTTTNPLQFTMQTGANNGQVEAISVPPVNLTAMGIASANLSTQTGPTGAMGAITLVDQAIAYISKSRSTMAATSNAMEHELNTQNIAKENQAASESRIRDADMADHMMDLTRHQILLQSSMSMLSIANDSRAVMSLFS